MLINCNEEVEEFFRVYSEVKRVKRLDRAKEFQKNIIDFVTKNPKSYTKLLKILTSELSDEKYERIIKKLNENKEE